MAALNEPLWVQALLILSVGILGHYGIHLSSGAQFWLQTTLVLLTTPIARRFTVPTRKLFAPPMKVIPPSN